MLFFSINFYYLMKHFLLKCLFLFNYFLQDKPKKEMPTF
jgi:hypothetical protein